MNCQSFRQEFINLPSGPVALDALPESLLGHLGICSECATLIDRQIEMRSLLRGLPTQQVKPEFDALLAERLRTKSVKKPLLTRLFSGNEPRILPVPRRALKPLWAACGLATVMVSLVMYHPIAPAPRTSPDENALISQCIALHQTDVAAQPLAAQAPVHLASQGSAWSGDTVSDSAGQESL